MPFQPPSTHITGYRSEYYSPCAEFQNQLLLFNRRVFLSILTFLLFFPLTAVRTSAQTVSPFSVAQSTGTSVLFFEDFEDAPETASYITDTLGIGGNDWFFEDALIGTRDEDRKAGDRSVRIRNGSLTMLFDVPEAGYVEYLAANTGFAADGDGKVQVYLSTDQGRNWTPAGAVAVPGDEPELHRALINSDAPVRIRWVRTDGNRINIDNIRVLEYFDIPENPSISLAKSMATLQPGGTVSMPVTVAGSPSELVLGIVNRGLDSLQIGTITIGDNRFILTPPAVAGLAFDDTTNISIRFETGETGTYQTLLTIPSNDPALPVYEITVTVDVVSQDDIIPIALARELPLGTRVTVGGRVTVAGEFNGPVFFQDASGGLAATYVPLRVAVTIGDSITVNGPLTEFNPFGGSTPGLYLRQIAARGTDTEINFEVFSDDRRVPDPVVLTLSDIRTNDYEAQLVTVNSLAVLRTGVYGSNQNTPISDPTANLTLRIDGATGIPGDTVRSGPVSITGVIDRFNSVLQLKPRFRSDMEPESYEGMELSGDETFDIVTWNIEWFGSSGSGPSDLELQYQNVLALIRRIDADVYAFQEISSPAQFQRLANDLDEYRGFLAGFDQEQKTGYLFKPATVDSLTSGPISAGQSIFDWAGRLPLLFRFNIDAGGQTKTLNTVNIHAKAFATGEDYERRVNASSQIKNYFDSSLSGENIIFLGDYNDDVTVATWQGAVSPYQNFVDDAAWDVVTRRLSENGFTSFRFTSTIDHISISEPLFQYHLEGAQRVENPSYISNYLNNTSDHFPVWTRFYFGTGVSVPGGEAGLPVAFTLEPNYPNPFNPSTNIRFILPESADVSITVYDITGRRVAVLTDGARYSPGSHTVRFDAGGLASGIYLYHLVLGDGRMLTGKMAFVK
ncbi:MAG: T9SS type A sorting domain-containing protein [Cyclonatronaceae bacterium]